MITRLMLWWRRKQYDYYIHLDRGDVITLLIMAAQLHPDDFPEKSTKSLVRRARDLSAYVRQYPDCKIALLIDLSRLEQLG